MDDGEAEPEPVIPTLLLAGLVLGRWWRVVIPAGVVAWVLAAAFWGDASGGPTLFGAAALAAANLIVGVLVHRALWIVAQLIGERGKGSGHRPGSEQGTHRV